MGRPESEEAEAAVWSPRLDLVESEDAYLVQIDVPGVTKDDITINFHEGAVSVSGERRMEELSESDDCIHLERTFGRFYRMFTLPKAVNDQKISASYADGVLHLRIPKTEESKPRRIQIG
jgi:HSP20 family protein